tara:strand:- start:859 stop:1011 length:153 start_codon:yes stop_codon:yes gene_type:complete
MQVRYRDVLSSDVSDDLSLSLSLSFVFGVVWSTNLSTAGAQRMISDCIID